MAFRQARHAQLLASTLTPDCESLLYLAKEAYLWAMGHEAHTTQTDDWNQQYPYLTIVQVHQTPVLQRFKTLEAAKLHVDNELQTDFYPIGIYHAETKTIYFSHHTLYSRKYLVEAALKALQIGADEIAAQVWY